MHRRVAQKKQSSSAPLQVCNGLHLQGCHTFFSSLSLATLSAFCRFFSSLRTRLAQSEGLEPPGAKLWTAEAGQLKQSCLHSKLVAILHISTRWPQASWCSRKLSVAT